MNTTTLEQRTTYVVPQTRVKETATERHFLASVTIPVYGETEEEEW